MAFNRILQHFTSSQELAPLWETGQNYILNQLVLQNDQIYRCISAHLSTTFSVDLAAGDWVLVSANASGKNYLLNPDFNDGVSTYWGLFNTTLTSKIPTGSITAGAASITTFAADSTTPIEGAFDLRVASSGAITAGHGFISDAFTIDREDQAKVMGFSFAYEAVSGTMNFSGTSNNTWAVYIYDVSGAAWLQPAGVYNLTQGSGIGIASGTFQTTATGTQYRIAIICITATSGAVEMRFDNFQLGPQGTVQGAAISDWASYTPTITHNSGGITNATPTGKYRRVGDSIEVYGTITFSAASAAFTEVFASLPAGLTFDTSKLSVTTSLAPVLGTAFVYDSGLTLFAPGNVAYRTSTSVDIRTPRTASGTNPGVNIVTDVLTNTVPITFASGDTINWHFTAPITGWSSNTVMSNDTDTRVVAASVYPAVAQPALVSGASTKILFDTINFPDTHAAFDFSNDWYRAPVSGWYSINSTIAFPVNSVGSRAIGYRIDGGVVRWMAALQAPTGDFGRIGGSALAYLNAGSTVEIFAFQNSGSSLAPIVGPDFTQFSINRLSGPATIASSESVVEIRENLAGTTINVGFTKIPYTSLVKSTHSAWNLVNSRFISPVSGTYQITFLYQHIYNVPGSQRPFELAIRKNGSADILFPYRTSLQTSTDGSYGDRYTACLSATTQLNAGEYIEFYSSSPNGSANLNVQAGTNRISIFRIGN
jgi:hypothetical protein